MNGRLSALREWIARALASFGSRRRDADIEEELRLHLELAADETRRRGEPDMPAARAAVVRHGAVAPAMESMRDQRGLGWLDDLARDVRHAVRTLVRTPVFTAVVLLTLAIGIGANTAVFSVVNGILLKPLPYPRADELVSLWHTAPGAAGMGNLSSDLRLSPSMYFTYAEHNRTFSSLGVWFSGTATVTGAGDPEEVRDVLVSDGVLQALGVPPLVGRSLDAADQDPGAAVRAVVLGYGYWMRRFGGDTSIVGRTITVDSNVREVVGVMPKNFRVVDAEPDLLVPFAFNRSGLRLPGFGLQAVARLKPGITIAEASADVARLVPIWMRSWPMAPGLDATIYETWQITPALRPLAADVVGNVTRVLWLLASTIGIVLLVACANVAGLMLVRMEGRQTELAVRAALGAGRGRIVRALLVESAILALAGGALGVVLAAVGVHLLVSYGPDTLPRLHEISVDVRALGFAFAASLLASALFGALPAVRYAQLRIVPTLRSGGRTSSESSERHRVRNGLVVAQVALALVLLVASGLMIRTFQALRSVEPGFTTPDEIQTLQVTIPASLVPEAERAARLEQDIVDRLTAIPGVTSAAFASVVPMVGRTPDWDVVFVEGRQYAANDIPPMRFFKSVSPRFFETMGTRVVAGRNFTWTDLYDKRRVVMVSENMARELWGSSDAAVGKRFRMLPDAPWHEVSGVVQNVHEHGADAPAPTIVYWPSFGGNRYQSGGATVARAVTFTVRSREAGTERLLASARRAVWSANGSLSVASEQTMTQIYGASMKRTSFALVLLAVAGVMALALGVIGIYGVISYTVSRHTREIGIRLALGAPPRGVRWMFVANGLRLTVLGTAIGLVAAAGLSRAMTSIVFGISPFDPTTYVLVPIVLGTAAFLASDLPARRASRLDPVRALQHE